MATSRSHASVIELETYSSTIPSTAVANSTQSETPTTRAATRDDRSSEPPPPPADGGFAAWRLVCVFYVFEALLWGFPLSYGVFQNYYSQLPEFENDPYISVVGTIASGMGYIGAPLVTPLIRRYLGYRRQMIWVGWPICILSLVAGSFAKTLPTLILTQGVMYGTGFLIFYYPILSMIDEFWIARKGMVYGLLCSASGASGAIMPLIIQALLTKYGYPTTLRAIAVALCVLTGPLIPFLKPRFSASQRDRSEFTINWGFLKKRLFWIYSISNLIQGLGYFFPSLYLPSYAHSIGLGAKQGALLLTAMSISQVLGQFTFGYFSDRRIPLNVLITISLVVSSSGVFALWMISRSFGPLLVFAMLYGFFGAGYTAMWARMVSAVNDDQSTALAMFSFFCLGKGVGNILAGPISAGLLQLDTHQSNYGAMKYKAVVIFTGVAMLLSTASIFTSYLKPRR